MTNLFKKAVLFTDLHLGAKGNSDLHNNDCIEFIEWMITEAKENGCETCFFLGDYHNNRASMNIKTMSYALKGLELLSANFSQVFFIPGNHDLFLRASRDYYSTEWARHLPNITVINDFFEEGNVSIIPWLLHDEHKRIQKIKSKYMMGHFELPSFYMNSHVMMPEHGDLKREHFEHIETVLSGHFHKRQNGKNITYIGNCFPHNYSDAGDDERGIGILEWDKPIIYKSWPKQPRYRVYNLSDVLAKTDTLLKDRMHVRVNLDIPISYEEASFIKNTFIEQYGLREIALMPAKSEELLELAANSNVKFESVDQIVHDQLSLIDSNHYDQKLLVEIYKNL